MQKIYVLLRQDRQTGPYSLEEIIQFDLKPYDLIWIQGGSAGWYYPQEIAALHPYLSFLPKKQQPLREAGPQNVFVANPAVSQRAEMPAPPPAGSSFTPEETVVKQPGYSSAAALEDAVYAQFREKAQGAEAFNNTAAPPAKKPGNRVVVGMATILIVGGVFAASWIMNRQDMQGTETHQEALAGLPAEEEISSAAGEQTTAVAAKASSSAPQKTKSRTVSRQFPVSTKTARTATAQPVTETERSDPEMVNVPAAPQPDESPAVISDEDNTGNDAPETATPQEKKTKLRDKLFAIFRKKPADARQEEAPSGENRPGERTTSRREEGAGLAQMVHVRFDVPNEWMMGIHGAKATLVNRSNETVQKATVEVQYFDDDNQLLQKKIISFDKISGKGTKTVSIPDHATATKVAYSIVSVVGKPAA